MEIQNLVYLTWYIFTPVAKKGDLFCNTIQYLQYLQHTEHIITVSV